MAAMPHDDQTPLTRLYERLTEALQRTRRDPFNVPVTVAEIYQELVPYRLVRAEIGFDMNADYEHALLRLLAGEGECVRIEPAHAAEEIRRELRSANPNLSIYRDYAACDVWVRKPTTPIEPRRINIASTPPAPVPSRTARPSGEPPPAGRASTSRPASEQKATPEPAPAKPAPAAGANAEPPASEQRKSTRPGAEPASGRQPKQKEAGTANPAHWRSPAPAHLKDILLPDEAPDAAASETLTLAGDDRPDDREEKKDDERAAAVTPMKETPKREAASAGESAAKSARSANPPRAAAAPAPAPSPGRAAPPHPTASKSTAQAAKPEAARCAFCDSQMPQQRQARFCPYCGADQTTRPCPSCGEALEPGWAFCITCGATAQ